MGLEPERSLEVFFFKIQSELSLILFLCFLRRFFISNAQRTFLTLQFAHPMIKIAQFG